MEKSVEHGLDYYIGTMQGTEKKTQRATPRWRWHISATVFLIL